MNYESTNGCFPAQAQNPAQGTQTLLTVGWIPPLLQYIEGGAFYAALNFNVDLMGTGFGGYSNSTVTTANLSFLQCPSESVWTPLRVWANGIRYGMTNYAGNYGGPGMIQPMSGTIIPANNGIIGSVPLAGGTTSGPNTYGGVAWSPVRIASITDGTSNTGLISERVLGQGTTPATINSIGFPSVLRCSIHSYTTNTGQGTGAAGAQTMMSACANAPGTTVLRFCGGNGQMWASSFPTWLVINSYNHFGTPNQIPCTNDSDPGAGYATYYVTPLGSAPPSSFHAGGVNEAYADGSVRFIKNSIAAQTWWALGSRSGSEIVSADAF